MPIAIDTVAGSAVNPGANPAVVTMATGDSNVVRNATQASTTHLEAIIRKGATAGIVRVRSPLLHDVAQAIRLRGLAASGARITPLDFTQPVRPQDNLIIELSGGAAETDVVILQHFYEDLPGAKAVLKAPGDVVGSIDQILGQEVAVVAAAGIGTWSDTAINATFDTLKANRWYAVLGYLTDTELACVAVKGQATGNLRVGGPGSTLRSETRRYFVDVSDATGRPHIPVLDSADKAGTFVSVLDSAASTAANITLILGLLRDGWAP